jgi:hypothetical protein
LNQSLDSLPHTRWRLPRAVAALTGLIVAVSQTAALSTPSSTAREDVARAAHVIAGTATAHLHLVKAEGSQLIEEGAVSGAFVGSVHGKLYTGATFTATFTIHTQSGSISGRGQATPHGAGRYQSFAGTFVASGGTGRYAHVSGHAGLSGVFDRRTDAVVIQTSGTLSY